MDYSTLNGLMSKLLSLKSKITTLKGKCNSEILMLQDDQWSKVEDYLQEVIDRVANAKDTWPSKYGLVMQNLDTQVKSK